MIPPLPNRLTLREWDAIAAAYIENAETLSQIAVRHGISIGAISNRARKEGWPRRMNKGGKWSPSITFEGRLTRALDRQISELETRWSGDNEDMDSARAEKEARTLSVLIRTAEKLKEIEAMAKTAKASKTSKSNDPSAKSDQLDRKRMRETLERRLDQLIASAQAQGISEQPDGK